MHVKRKKDRARINSTVSYAVTEDEIRQASALTYGKFTLIHDAVGRILDHLEALGLAEDTVVILTSDHGDFMGHQGLLLTSALLYASVVRVPFIWADPDANHAGTATAGLWTTMDIAPTILARAGLAPSFGTQGRSFLNAVDTLEHPGRDQILIEEDGHAPTFGLREPVRARTAITRTHRLTVYDKNAWGELYDLEHDPNEMENIFRRPEGEQAWREMFEVLCMSILEAADRLPQPTRRA